jgi:16S rRNA (cytidine1402-2'-O)-methyltransferase
MIGTLYVVGAPAGDPDDLTLRARRVLREASVAIAQDADRARALLARHSLDIPVISAMGHQELLQALGQGSVALLLEGRLPGPTGPDLELVRVAMQGGFSVAAVPGPALPVTALIVSGLPADSFVFLGPLPAQPIACRRLLASIAEEPHTLVVTSSAGHLARTLVELHHALGDRPLMVMAASAATGQQTWRGTLPQAAESLGSDPFLGDYALVIGGAEPKSTRWDENRLRTQIGAGLAQGLRAKELSQQLAAVSGWSRREIYRLVVEQSETPANDRKET